MRPLTVKAIRVHECGGPEAIRLEELPLPVPGPGQVLVEVKAAGVNLFDTQLRSGLYKRDLPVTLGLEGAGIVHAVGGDVDDVAIGDRVAWIFASGSYATHTLAAAERVVPIPDGIGFEGRRGGPVPGADGALSRDFDFSAGAGINLSRPFRSRRLRNPALSDGEDPRR